jgi:hypothetical protein
MTTLAEAPPCGIGTSFLLRCCNSFLIRVPKCLRSRARTAAAAAAAWMMSSWAAWAYLLKKFLYIFSEAGPGRQQQQQLG